MQKCAKLGLRSSVTYFSFGTTDGFIDDGKTITAPALMFVKAVDTLFEKLKTTSLLARVKSISASGQQHGTVYWKTGSKEILANLDHSKELLLQLRKFFNDFLHIILIRKYRFSNMVILLLLNVNTDMTDQKDTFASFYSVLFQLTS